MPSEQVSTIHLPFPSFGRLVDVELVPVAGLAFATPAQTSECVLTLCAAGIPAASSSCQVYAEETFARAWPLAIARYRTTPRKGRRLTKAIERTLALTTKQEEDTNA